MDVTFKCAFNESMVAWEQHYIFSVIIMSIFYLMLLFLYNSISLSIGLIIGDLMDYNVTVTNIGALMG